MASDDGKVRVAIVGVGNCAAALLQGVTFYQDVPSDAVVPGLMHPVLGWGLESSRYFGMWDIPGVDWSIGPVHHPHNPILQIWVELGAIGVALAGLIMIGIVLSIPRLPGRRRSFAYGAITATLAISSVSHGAWQIWWICVLMLVVALFAIIGFAFMSFQVYLAPFLREKLGAGLQTAAVMWSVMGVSGILGGGAREKPAHSQDSACSWVFCLQ